MPIADLHAPQPAPTIASLRWRERAVLVFAGGDGAAARQQATMLAGEGAGLRERDLRVAVVEGAHVVGLADDAVALRRRFDVGDGHFAVLLIGKDGHVARRSDTPVAAADLFRQIDAMPMRRDEIRRRGR